MRFAVPLAAVVAAVVLGVLGAGHITADQTDGRRSGAAVILGADAMPAAPVMTDRLRSPRPLLPVTLTGPWGLFAVAVVVLGILAAGVDDVGRLAALSLRRRRRGPPEPFNV
jgi:hypothetical protein